MEDADEDFPSKVKAGDLIIAEANFGCGSSREHAPIAIKAAGVQAVVAKSFARIFYRNAFNIGLPIFESEEASEKIKVKLMRTGVLLKISPAVKSTRRNQYRLLCRS
jgi:3-isopropylmalate dehydratase small subunit